MICQEKDIVQARQLVRDLSRKLGFGKVEETRIVTVVSELTRNILHYAGKGYMRVEHIESNQSGIKISAIDQGPGIQDVQKALQYSYSNSGGMGAGLPGVQNIMDEFTIDSVVGEGTQVYAIKWKNPDKTIKRILKPIPPNKVGE